MNSKYRSLPNLLQQHYGATNEEGGTHTRIPRIYANGKKKGGGIYTIPDENMDVFWELYYDHVIANRESEFLTEKQYQIGSGKTGPLLIDLDFKHDACIQKRQINKVHITKFIDAVLSELEQLFVFQDDNEFKVFVMYKQNVNCLEQYTKDGIHFVFTIKMDHIMQGMLREKIIKKIPEIFEGVKYTNEAEDIYDNSITRGSTNWQIFGSRKPKHDPYKLKILYEYRFDGNQGDFDSDEKNIKEYTGNREKYIQLLKEMSARNANGLELELQEDVRGTYSKFKHKAKGRKKKKKVKKGGANKGNNQSTNSTGYFGKSIYDYSAKYDEMVDIDHTKRIRRLFIGKMNNGSYEGPLQIGEYNIFEAHQFAMSLSSEYFDNYAEWMRVGWALKNTDPHKLFPTWVEFSAQSDKFDDDDFEASVENLRHIWHEEMVFDEEGLTDASIKFWLRMQDPDKFNEINQQSISYFVNCTLMTEAAEWNFAKLMQKLYGDKYAYAGGKEKIWYHYSNHRWVKKESENFGLRKKLSTEVYTFYNLKLEKTKKQITQAKNIENIAEKKAKLEELSTIKEIVTKACRKTRSNTDKKKIMCECTEVFYDPDFFKRLDDNPYLLGFTNGVIDFKEKVFRDGKHSDYLSMSTGRKYIPYDEEKHGKIRLEIEEFMNQLFPIPELCAYMWDHLASVLIGGNINQTFNMYNGSGSNGKSKLIELMELALGDYKGTVPVTMVTNERTGLGAVSPEIASLKGIRYAVMQEPSPGQELNPGPFKELTGGDTLQGRHLYQNSITFKPQFSLVVCTNDMFEIKATDDGTWRRIKPVPFLSKFGDYKKPFCDPKNEKWQFKIDRGIKENFERWVDVFMGLLVKRAFETGGEVKNCAVIERRKRKYRFEQDPIHEFTHECIQKEEGTNNFITNIELWNVYLVWYKNIKGSEPKGKKKFYCEFSRQIDCEMTRDPLDKRRRGWCSVSLVDNDHQEPNGI